MATKWKWRMNVIVQADDTEAFNALWTLIGPEGDDEVNTFGVPLSANGKEPATHSGMSSAATDQMKRLVEDTLAAELSGAIISIQDSSVNDYKSLLSDNGLEPIEPELPQ